MSIPTPVSADAKLQNQAPAPPVDRQDTPPPPTPTERNLQRQHKTSTRFNTLVCPGRLWAEWVMEPEVPKPATDQFLRWATRRAFVDDNVQLRVQINGHVVDAAAEVTIVLRRQGAPATEELLRILSANPGGALPVGTVVRPMTQAPRALGEISEIDTQTKIYFEGDAAGHRSYLATTIKLPERPPGGAGEHDVEFYLASVDIRHCEAHYSTESPRIEVRRWWALADQNLGLPRTTSAMIEDLIDGDKYFGRVAAAMNGATAGTSIYIAGWSTNVLVFLAGGAGAPAAAATSPHFLTATSNTVIGHIRRAAVAGANVYILLDAVNGSDGTGLIEYLVDNFPAPVKNRIFVRTVAHPYRPSLGIGPFKTPPEQVGTYHEKYVCVTGGGVERALVGGIDFGPDQYSPSRHTWRCNFNDYRDMCTNRIHPDLADYFRGKLMLWHDIAVQVEAKTPVQYLADDFVRRWNSGDGSVDYKGANLPAPALTPLVAGGETVQLVKTENIDGTGRVTRAITNGKYYGTSDVWGAAIREARHYIYMENQYIRDLALCDALCDALQKNPILQLIIVVPFLSEEQFRAAGLKTDYEEGWALPTILKMKFWYDEAQQNLLKGELMDRMKVNHGNFLAHEFVRKLRAAAPTRFGLFTLANGAMGAPEMIYPHSKIMIVDDTWAYIGSANANGKSMKIDAEVGFAFHDRTSVTAFRRRLWLEHFQANWDTRDIRDFLTKWSAAAVAAKKQLSDCSMADFAGGVQAVGLLDVPEGQKYNGPGSWLHNVDDEV